MNPNDIRLVHRREQLQLRLQATHDTPKAIDDIVGYIVDVGNSKHYTTPDHTTTPRFARSISSRSISSAGSKEAASA